MLAPPKIGPKKLPIEDKSDKKLVSEIEMFLSKAFSVNFVKSPLANILEALRIMSSSTAQIETEASSSKASWLLIKYQAKATTKSIVNRVPKLGLWKSFMGYNLDQNY